jgi:hypothetical protein
MHELLMAGNIQLFMAILLTALQHVLLAAYHLGCLVDSVLLIINLTVKTSEPSSPTSGGRSVGIVRLRTKVTEIFVVVKTHNICSFAYISLLFVANGSLLFQNC